MKSASEWIDKWMDQLGVPAEIRLSEALCEAYKLGCTQSALCVITDGNPDVARERIIALRDSKTPEWFL